MNYDIRLAKALWGNTIFSKNIRIAIRQFLNDPIHHFRDGIYTIEVRGKGFFKVVKKTVCHKKFEFLARF